MGHLLWTVLIGFVAGIIAKMLTPGAGPSGFIWTAVLGVGGAVLSTWLGQTMGWYKSGDAASFIGAVVGAIVLLLVYNVIAKKKS